MKRWGESQIHWRKKSAWIFSITVEYQTRAFLPRCNRHGAYPSKSSSKIKFMRSGINREADRDAFISLCSLPININAFPRCWHCDTPWTGAGCVLARLSASLHTDEPLREAAGETHTHTGWNYSCPWAAARTSNSCFFHQWVMQPLCPGSTRWCCSIKGEKSWCSLPEKARIASSPPRLQECFPFITLALL